MSGSPRWKALYERVKRKKRMDRAMGIVDDDRLGIGCTLQRMDGDFFDQLADLMKKNAEDCDVRVLRTQMSLARRASNAFQDGEAAGDGEEAAARVRRSCLPVPEEAVAEPEDKARLLSDALGSNIDMLYVDVLHTILHTVGCSVNGENDKTSLFNHLQAAFKFDDEKHDKLMEQARIKEAPNILLHVEVIEAVDIVPMDANGLSDTFCTVYLTSCEQQQYHTTVKMSTLCPEWKEHFCLPVKNTPEESLCIEAWDFDPAETIRGKLMKVGVVKGMKGWGKFVREFGSSGKNENEFIGSAVLSLNSIKAAGETRWCDLEKKGKTSKRGRVKVKLAFSTQKSKEAAFKDHRNLLRLLLLHELESNEVEPYSWRGEFEKSAEIILTQHLLQSGLPPPMDLLAQWVEYCNIHADHPLNFYIFYLVLKKLLPHLQSNMFDTEKEVLFWEAAKALMPSCFNGIKRLHMLTPNDKNYYGMSSLLRVLSCLRCVPLPKEFELFPSSMYEWILPLENDNNCGVTAAIKSAIVKGTEEWYDDIIQNNVIDTNNSSEGKTLNHIITIIKKATKDLHLTTDFYGHLFQQILQLPYGMILFSAHGYKISELVEPVIGGVHEVLKPLKFNGEPTTEANEDDVYIYGMQLFDLYLTLQRFVVLGSGLSSQDPQKHKLSEYHRWFHRSVAQWLDIALWKALKRIKKAVELDNLEPVSDSVKHSSSAIDTLGIFHQIKVFWQELAWPDVEESYVFVAKIIDDICHCSIYYAHIMCQRIEQLPDNEIYSDDIFLVTKDRCRPMNNIEYIWNAIEPFVSELGMNDVVKELAHVKSAADTEQCKRTLKLVIENAMETVGTKLADLLDKMVQKMIPAIHRLLLEGTEMLHEGENRLDDLLLYLDANITILHTELNNEIFNQLLMILWEKIAIIFFDVIENSLEGKKPRTYFSNLQKALDILFSYFGTEEVVETNGEANSIKKVQKILALHSMDTSQLIQKFYLERLEEQKAMGNSPLGTITIFAEFGENVLKIDVLSGRNLRPMDSNGSCDPYVEVALLPADKFVGVPKQTTKTQKKTLFPLFDEKFFFELTRDQREAKDSMVHFTVKDKDMLGNELVGEAFISFVEIESDGRNENQDLQQIHLNLSVPKNLDSKISKTLKMRQGDKVAKEFIKKQIAKANAH